MTIFERLFIMSISHSDSLAPESLSKSDVIQFKKLHADAIIPTRGTNNSAGFDLYALEDTIVIGGGGNVLVPTGIAVQLPEGTYGRIAMRSGLAVKQHLSVSAGVIDIDYTGGIGVVTYCTKLFDTNKIHKRVHYVSLQDNSTKWESPREWVDYESADESVEYDLESSTTENHLMINSYDQLCPVITPHLYVIKKGERFAQLIPEKISYPEIIVVEQFQRQYEIHLGYGSTGQTKIN